MYEKLKVVKVKIVAKFFIINENYGKKVELWPFLPKVFYRLIIIMK